MAEQKKTEIVDETLGNDIYHNMRFRELQRLRAHHDKASQYVRCRKILVVWVIEVCEAFGLSNLTAFLACDLVDRFFTESRYNHREHKGEFQLIAMACIAIAAKYQETDEKVPSMAELNDMSDNTYDKDALRDMELTALQAVNWEVAAVTPMCFLKYLLVRISSGVPVVDNHINRAVVLLLGLALQDHDFLQYMPSKLCCASLWCARYIVTQNGFNQITPWTPQMQAAFGYTEEELKACSNHLMAKYVEFSQLAAQVRNGSTPGISSISGGGGGGGNGGHSSYREQQHGHKLPNSPSQGTVGPGRSPPVSNYGQPQTVAMSSHRPTQPQHTNLHHSQSGGRHAVHSSQSAHSRHAYSGSYHQHSGFGNLRNRFSNNQHTGGYQGNRMTHSSSPIMEESSSPDDMAMDEM